MTVKPICATELFCHLVRSWCCAYKDFRRSPYLVSLCYCFTNGVSFFCNPNTKDCRVLYEVGKKYLGRAAQHSWSVNTGRSLMRHFLRVFATHSSRTHLLAAVCFVEAYYECGWRAPRKRVLERKAARPPADNIVLLPEHTWARGVFSLIWWVRERNFIPKGDGACPLGRFSRFWIFILINNSQHKFYILTLW